MISENSDHKLDDDMILAAMIRKKSVKHGKTVP